MSGFIAATETFFARKSSDVLDDEPNDSPWRSLCDLMDNESVEFSLGDMREVCQHQMERCEVPRWFQVKVLRGGLVRWEAPLSLSWKEKCKDLWRVTSSYGNAIRCEIAANTLLGDETLFVSPPGDKLLSTRISQVVRVGLPTKAVKFELETGAQLITGSGLPGLI